MSFGRLERSSGAPPMSDINMTPLIDVMLVLLVIFMIAAPLLVSTVKVDLPKAAASAHEDKPEAIRLAIKAEGQLFWNDQPVTESELPARFAAATQANPLVELHLRADREARYDAVARAMAAAQGNGVAKIGFVTEAK